LAALKRRCAAAIRRGTPITLVQFVSFFCFVLLGVPSGALGVPGRSLGHLLGDLGGLLWPLGGAFWPHWVPIGRHWGACWVHCGLGRRLWAPCWVHCGAIGRPWGALWAHRRPLGPLGVHLGSSWASWGAILCDLGARPQTVLLTPPRRDHISATSFLKSSGEDYLALLQWAYSAITLLRIGLDGPLSRDGLHGVFALSYVFPKVKHNCFACACVITSLSLKHV
jgi:hypothetical protein